MHIFFSKGVLFKEKWGSNWTERRGQEGRETLAYVCVLWMGMGHGDVGGRGKDRGRMCWRGERRGLAHAGSLLRGAEGQLPTGAAEKVICLCRCRRVGNKVTSRGSRESALED